MGTLMVRQGLWGRLAAGIAVGFLFFGIFLMIGQRPAEAAPCAACPVGYSPNGSGCEGVGGVMIACPGNGLPEITQDPPSAMGEFIKWESAQRQNTSDTSTANEDPWVNITSTDDKGATMRSSTGAFGAVNGLSQSSRTTDLGTGAAGSFNASKEFSLGAQQRVVFSGIFQYDSINTSFSANPLAAGLNVASAQQSTYTFIGSLRYYVADMYFNGFLGGDWGNGTLTNNGSGGIGKFQSESIAPGVTIGKTFTLFGSSDVRSSAMPTKAPPRPSNTALQLDLNAGVLYVNGQVSGFTDSSGFTRGTEENRYWDASGSATLIATMPSGGVVWRPFLGATLDQQIGFSHTLDIPTQAATAADTISYGSAQTLLGTRAGINAVLANGLILGVEGFYQESAEFTVVGARASVRYVFPE
jgi:hypothetical protein